MKGTMLGSLGAMILAVSLCGVAQAATSYNSLPVRQSNAMLPQPYKPVQQDVVGGPDVVDNTLDLDPIDPYILMTADTLIARPLLLGATAVGVGVFVVSLPFSFLGGNVGDSADALVKVPAVATFQRCLGCK